MSQPTIDQLKASWARNDAEWRDPAQIVSQWRDAVAIDLQLLRHTVQGSWWDVLKTAGITLFVTREYEHLVMALRVDDSGPVVSFMPLPHPSGLTVDRDRGLVHVASTRNPNQVYDLQPISGMLPRKDVRSVPLTDQPLVPVRSRFLPGCTYVHDLAIIGGVLHANAVGQNVVVRLDSDCQYEAAWWPKCIEMDAGLATDRNYLQLNSIAAGQTLETSFFSASTDRISARRPGHHNFAVDKRGVVFSGTTREPIVHGLTRPHSARLFDDRLWVDNSGYGEVGLVEDGRFTPVARLPGWTRGLCFHGRTAFVGTSRVIPRFRHYAPGLDAGASVCGVHAIDVVSGKVLGSLIWPSGNQIFAIDWAPNDWTTGFPFTTAGKRATNRERVKSLFYAFQVAPQKSHAKQRAHCIAPAQSVGGNDAADFARNDDEMIQRPVNHPESEGT